MYSAQWDVFCSVSFCLETPFGHTPSQHTVSGISRGGSLPAHGSQGVSPLL